MPNIYTHVIFAQELVNTTMTSKQKDMLENRSQLYEIGANGPDYLYFHGTTPKKVKEKSHVRTLGKYCHRRGINDFYHQALEVIRNEKEADVKQGEIAYIMGHLTHWALDSTTHPYIFWRTGSGDSASQFRHHRMESLLDAIVLKIKKGKTIKDYKVYKVCEVDIDDVRAIARIYVNCAKKVYGVQAKPHEILQALNEWAQIQKLLYDRKGKKLKAFQTIEETIKQSGLVSGMIVPNEPDDPCDVCNLLHKEWNHPCDADMVSTDSFLDLYDHALKRAQKAIDLFLDAVDDSAKEEAFLSYLNNRNYTKGLPDNPPMVYFDPDCERNGELMLKEQK